MDLGSEHLSGNSNIIDQALKASEIEVATSVTKIYGDQDMISYPSGVSLYLATGGFPDNPKFAGFTLHLTRDYSDKTPKPITDLFKDNQLKFSSALFFRNQNPDSIVTPHQAHSLEKTLLGLANGNFSVRYEQKPLKGSKLLVDNLITLNDIKDAYGNPLDIGIEINLGFDNLAADSVYREDLNEEQELAQANNREGELVTSYTIPRPYGIEFRLTDSTGKPISTNDPQHIEKLKQGLNLMITAMEATLKTLSGKKEQVNLPPKTTNEIIRLQNSDEEFHWMEEIQ